MVQLLNVFGPLINAWCVQATTRPSAYPDAVQAAPGTGDRVSLSFSWDGAAFASDTTISPSGQGWSGAGYMGRYEIDTTLEVQGIFINSLTGVYADPTSIGLFILDPGGFLSTQNWPSGGIVRDSLGHFHFILTPAKSGNWTYKWQGFGAAVATSPDTTFTVVSSALIAG